LIGRAPRPAPGVGKSQAEPNYFAVQLSAIVKWVTITPDRAAFLSLMCWQTATATKSDGDLER
jgi:hypothetical protein